MKILGELSMSMDDSIDNKLNSKSGFQHPVINKTTETRLLQISQHPTSLNWQYDLIIVSLDDLASMKYRALSYTWGKATTIDHIQTIRVNNQDFAVRQNLFDFLASVTTRNEHGLIFIDAICINQLDYDERQAQVHAMSMIYTCASSVISWLGILPPEYYDGCRTLSQSFDVSCENWSQLEWKALRYLSYAPYWSRVWVVQEILLAANLTVWCGPFTFHPTLLGRTPQAMETLDLKFSTDGRPNVSRSDGNRVRCPSEAILTHRLRHVPRIARDTLPEGCPIGTLDEMTAALCKPSMSFEIYQSRIPDELHDIIHKFGHLNCTDVRDRLYGFLGLLNKRCRNLVKPDYQMSVEYAFYQALKVELRPGLVVNSRGLSDRWISHYCGVRDAFKLGDEISMKIFREVCRELDVKTRMRAALFQEQWDLNFGYEYGEIDAVHHSFTRMLMGDEPEDTEESFAIKDPTLLRFHIKQRHLCEKISMKLRWRSEVSYRRLLSRGES